MSNPAYDELNFVFWTSFVMVNKFSGVLPGPFKRSPPDPLFPLRRMEACSREGAASATTGRPRGPHPGSRSRQAWAGFNPRSLSPTSSRSGNGHLGVGSAARRAVGDQSLRENVRHRRLRGRRQLRRRRCLLPRWAQAHRRRGGSYGADGTEYRTEEDTFARITMYRSPNQRIDRSWSRPRTGASVRTRRPSRCRRT